MKTSACLLLVVLGLAVSQAVPTGKIEDSLKEASSLETTQLETGDDKDRAKKSAEYFAGSGQPGDHNVHQIRIQPQHGQSCGCNTQQLQSILLPAPQPVVQPVHTLHILSQSQPCGQNPPTVNIVQPQTPAQPPQTLNIIQPSPPCPKPVHLELQEPEPEPQPEPQPEPEPEPEPEQPPPEPIELEIVQQPCNEQVVVVPSKPMYLMPEMKPQLATVVEVPQPCQHVMSECSCRPRTSAYRTAVETVRYAPSTTYRQVVPLTRTIRSEQEADEQE